VVEVRWAFSTRALGPSAPGQSSRPPTDATAPGPQRRRSAHPSGAADCDAARRGEDDQRGRRGGVPQPQDDRVPPPPRLPEARYQLPRAARAGTMPAIPVELGTTHFGGRRCAWYSAGGAASRVIGDRFVLEPASLSQALRRPRARERRLERTSAVRAHGNRPCRRMWHPFSIHRECWRRFTQR
jgi:hypothetical protein